jgi:hypothetical protein
MTRRRKKRNGAAARRRRKFNYDLRLKALRRCGFRSYQHYLSSPLWAQIRARVLERDSSRCVFCGASATLVHHESYGDVTLRGERLDKLHSCCNSCHHRIEFSAYGYDLSAKRSFGEAIGETQKAIRKAPKKWAKRALRFAQGSEDLGMSISERLSAGRAIREFVASLDSD